MNLQDYLIDATKFDWAELLREWAWLIPSKIRVWLLTRAGDLFITVEDGSLHFLDVGGGTFTKVAENRDEFVKKIDQPGVAADWFMIPVVDSLVAAGVILQEGYCYSFKILPTLGGKYDWSNRAALPVREHFGAWGSVQRQIATLPDGTEVVFKVG